MFRLSPTVLRASEARQRIVSVLAVGATAGAFALSAADRKSDSVPSTPPQSPARFNPDPGGQQTPLQSNSPPEAKPLPSLFTPTVPVAPARFDDDLPPRLLTLPRAAVRPVASEKYQKKWDFYQFHYPEYALSNNRIGLLPGFQPLTDRWTLPGTGLGGVAFPRYKDKRLESTYGYKIYSTFDPYKPSLLKGDFPIYKQDIFLNLTFIDQFEIEARRGQVGAGASYARPGNYEFFGRGDSYSIINNLSVCIELFKGETAFKPVEWAFKITPVFNINFFESNENNVKPDPRGGASNGSVSIPPPPPGTIRNPGDITNIFGPGFIPTGQDLAGTRYTRRLRNSVNLQEAFFEYHLKDLSTAYDFISVKAGLQHFNSDFRGLIFNDTNLGIRLFGNYYSNRWQYNLAYFSMREKDTFSGLNRFDARDQDVIIANFYRQDTIWLGYTAQFSFHANIDHGGRHYDRNGAITRPSPIGTVADHQVNAFYLGWAGDGHIGKLNISHAFYWALGQDKFNGIAGRKVDINAQMFALELSYDRDWLRPKFSFLYASGDNKSRDRRATGFDAINAQPFFFGNPFSYFARQTIGLGNTAITTKTGNGILNNLRTSPFEGQANFVNPGTLIAGLGLDVDVTPRLKMSLNANWVRFVTTDTLKTALFVNKVDRDLGYDLSVGFTYRPTLTQNIIITAGFGAFIPGAGYRDINRQLTRQVNGFTDANPGRVDRFLYSGIFAVTLTY
ncbi:MAG: hypothetical protein JSR82_02985 [Verrucomicrobia bacterium]|nr:hypothetical protein [Verrucomicrobiota bacterium]